jgi:hypothetical protein
MTGLELKLPRQSCEETSDVVVVENPPLAMVYLFVCYERFHYDFDFVKEQIEWYNKRSAEAAHDPECH